MTTCRALGTAAAVGLATAAHAQFQTQGTVTYTLTTQFYGPGHGVPWQNPVQAGGTTVLSPGLGVLFKITVGMSVPSGAATTSGGGTLGGPLTWASTIQTGSSGAGTNAGFWGGDINLIGDGGASTAAGTWSDGSAAWGLAVRRRLTIATAGGEIGAVNSNGSGLTDIQPAQFSADADSISHSNNFVTFQALWIPASYDERLVRFSVATGSLTLPSMVAAADQNYGNGYTLPVALTCATAFANPQTLQLVPAPANALLLAVGAVTARRRRIDRS